MKQRTIKPSRKPRPTSWEGVSSKYDKTVGKTGHYYHEKVILPNLKKILSQHPRSSKPYAILDLACGQGVLSRNLEKGCEYIGVDISPSLIASAQTYTQEPGHRFLIGDVTKPLPIEKKDFDLCTIILALQNIEHPLKVLQNAREHLRPEGRLLLVLNHPCFRIPRKSSWGVDESEEIQYRRVDGYASSAVIPILSQPSLGPKSPVTLSFHFSLETLTGWLQEAGFAVERLLEWSSDKKSTGRCARREDMARREIPLFLAVEAYKK